VEDAQDKSARRTPGAKDLSRIRTKRQRNVIALAQGYVMQDGELRRRSPHRKIAGDFYVDLGRYARNTTARTVKERYDVARDH
jgi:hypothetical protein